MPRAEISRITDLEGSTAPRRRGALARLSRWLNVEPNGIYVDWGERTLVFDCERPIDLLLASV
jgi:hypothetical protein